MSIKNSNEQYGRVAIALHWIMALLIVTMIIVGFSMGELPDGAEKWKVYGLHKASGLVVLAFALFRWYWMLTNAKPKPLASWTKAETGLSHATKWLLMLLIVIMPIAGIAMSITAGKDVNFFGLFSIGGFVEKNESLAEIFHQVHKIGAILITIIAGLHIIGALKHHFISKDDTLRRMLGRTNK